MCARDLGSNQQVGESWRASPREDCDGKGHLAVMAMQDTKSQSVQSPRLFPLDPEELRVVLRRVKRTSCVGDELKAA